MLWSEQHLQGWPLTHNVWTVLTRLALMLSGELMGQRVMDGPTDMLLQSGNDIALASQLADQHALLAAVCTALLQCLLPQLSTHALHGAFWVCHLLALSTTIFAELSQLQLGAV